jgi:D-alanine-D-alanine ligase
MTSPDRVRLVVLFGGQSAEHEVSCVTASHVLRAADPDRYELVPVGITHDGTWVQSGEATAALTQGTAALPSPLTATGTAVEPLPVVTAAAGELPVVVLPLLHGTKGEDGTVQGLLELANVPYVGAGVLSSALCMDKVKAKEVLSVHGLPQVPWTHVAAAAADQAEAAVAGAGLAYPLFVKPANAGSSVGVTKVKAPGDLAEAVALAADYDEWVVIEQGVVDGREIEVAVLGNAEPRASLPGEIVASREFYDYEDKYLSGECDLVIPAPLSADETARVRELALVTYRALRCEGMARVDFFLDAGGRFLVNEVNTIPGFTPGSMYPKMWEATGLAYPDLIDELVRLAVERHERRARLSVKR